MNNGDVYLFGLAICLSLSDVDCQGIDRAVASPAVFEGTLRVTLFVEPICGPSTNSIWILNIQ